MFAINRNVYNEKEIRYFSSLINYIENFQKNNMEYSEIQNQFVEVFLMALGARDAYTKEHSNRLSFLAREIGRELKLPPVEIKKIVLAAKLHDIGKIGISDAILLKPSKLTDEEFDEIKKHPVIGFDMLKNLSIFSHISDYILYHHEKFDGSGYPEKISGDDIPFGARIISIVDAIDAILTKRSYKEPKPVEYAVQELKKNAGTQFDPMITKFAIKVIEENKDVFKIK
ncbi:MAG: HD-GYP domain-containing protein [Candidatus Acidulodesulfobacterium acidiphilum]|uniref:HD-GYP domain-containing protein n=1 Tax=Candidatus Acidulodesulfobacterium acidiphilum TaxID=2597224 RepID=A0A520X662_9DELT|nr:MAG: HD-GYP domain-containing protein [Candidatus Acidulodesulfobacterium acidiphilum]